MPEEKKPYSRQEIEDLVNKTANELFETHVKPMMKEIISQHNENLDPVFAMAFALAMFSGFQGTIEPLKEKPNTYSVTLVDMFIKILTKFESPQQAGRRQVCGVQSLN